MRRFTLLSTLLLLSACAPMVNHTPAPAGEAPCIVAGCSSHLCVENNAANQGLVSTCIFKPEYACYPKHSKCEKQANGQCGWTPSPALSSCLRNPQ